MRSAQNILQTVPDLFEASASTPSIAAIRWDRSLVIRYVLVIALGAGCYGAAMGWWRSPEQAAFNSVKFPLILLATALGNGLINGMLAPLLGLSIRFRDSLMLVLMSFAVAAAILGSFAPLLWFLIWNTPPLELPESRQAAYGFVLLTQVIVVAFAGIAANLRLLSAIRRKAQSEVAARRVLFAWLCVNLLLGAQLCWNLRPLIGSPDLPVQFLRPDAFEGNFYEAVFHHIKRIFKAH